MSELELSRFEFGVGGGGGGYKTWEEPSISIPYRSVTEFLAPPPPPSPPPTSRVQSIFSELNLCVGNDGDISSIDA